MWGYSDLTKPCQISNNVSETKVSETDIVKLKADWTCLLDYRKRFKHVIIKVII